MLRVLRQRLVATAVVASVVAGGAAAASAATKTSTSSTTSSIALAAPTGGAAPTSYTPSLGTNVSFITTYPGTTKNPSIEVNCYQNGVLVWGTIGSVTDQYLLGGASSPWMASGGGANCVSTLENIVWVHKMEQKTVLATTSFAATAS